MSDLIDRQAAIKTAQRMCERCDTGDIIDYQDLVVESLKVLPSVQTEITEDAVEEWAYKRDLTIITDDLFNRMLIRWLQPEIIRCKDCIHGIPTRIDTVTGEFSDGRYCIRHNMCHFGDYYCADGKRKEK